MSNPQYDSGNIRVVGMALVIFMMTGVVCAITVWAVNQSNDIKATREGCHVLGGTLIMDQNAQQVCLSNKAILMIGG